MNRVLTSTEPRARKDHTCNACEFLFNSDEINGGEISFGAYRGIVKAKRNGCKIKKGEKYLKITGVYEGELYTFKAIPEINDICDDLDLYRE